MNTTDQSSADNVVYEMGDDTDCHDSTIGLNMNISEGEALYLVDNDSSLSVIGSTTNTEQIPKATKESLASQHADPFDRDPPSTCPSYISTIILVLFFCFLSSFATFSYMKYHSDSNVQVIPPKVVYIHKSDQLPPSTIDDDSSGGATPSPPIPITPNPNNNNNNKPENSNTFPSQAWSDATWPPYIAYKDNKHSQNVCFNCQYSLIDESSNNNNNNNNEDSNNNNQQPPPKDFYIDNNIFTNNLYQGPNQGLIFAKVMFAANNIGRHTNLDLDLLTKMSKIREQITAYTITTQHNQLHNVLTSSSSSKSHKDKDLYPLLENQLGGVIKFQHHDSLKLNPMFAQLPVLETQHLLPHQHPTQHFKFSPHPNRLFPSARIRMNDRDWVNGQGPRLYNAVTTPLPRPTTFTEPNQQFYRYFTTRREGRRDVPPPLKPYGGTINYQTFCFSDWFPQLWLEENGYEFTHVDLSRHPDYTKLKKQWFGLEGLPDDVIPWHPHLPPIPVKVFSKKQNTNVITEWRMHCITPPHHREWDDPKNPYQLHPKRFHKLPGGWSMGTEDQRHFVDQCGNLRGIYSTHNDEQGHRPLWINRIVELKDVEPTLAQLHVAYPWCKSMWKLSNDNFMGYNIAINRRQTTSGWEKNWSPLPNGFGTIFNFNILKLLEQNIFPSNHHHDIEDTLHTNNNNNNNNNNQHITKQHQHISTFEPLNNTIVVSLDLYNDFVDDVKEMYKIKDVDTSAYKPKVYQPIFLRSSLPYHYDYLQFQHKEQTIKPENMMVMSVAREDDVEDKINITPQNEIHNNINNQIERNMTSKTIWFDALSIQQSQDPLQSTVSNINDKERYEEYSDFSYFEDLANSVADIQNDANINNNQTNNNNMMDKKSTQFNTLGAKVDPDLYSLGHCLGKYIDRSTLKKTNIHNTAEILLFKVPTNEHDENAKEKYKFVYFTLIHFMRPTNDYRVYTALVVMIDPISLSPVGFFPLDWNVDNEYFGSANCPPHLRNNSEKCQEFFGGKPRSRHFAYLHSWFVNDTPLTLQVQTPTTTDSKSKIDKKTSTQIQPNDDVVKKPQILQSLAYHTLDQQVFTVLNLDDREVYYQEINMLHIWKNRLVCKDFQAEYNAYPGASP